MPGRSADGCQRRALPVGVQTFRKMREGGYYYVDKTPFLDRLIEDGTHYFLARPRRFGKSLLVDTLKELFEGSEALFRGLAIHEGWDWTVRRPVVRLSFGSGDFENPAVLPQECLDQLDALAREAGVEPRYDTGPARFRHLIRSLHRNSGRRVAVLVDEYDKPILDALEAPEAARANRNYLRGLYSVIKDTDASVHFTLLTGVSKFSKVSLFSGLNNLWDITLDPRYSSICGYSERDLDEVFEPELSGLDRSRVREWYNGYSWRGEERVYNPFDILLLFGKREFAPHWFETGTPSFLVDLLARRGVSSFKLDRMVADDELLSTFDVGDMATEALLFQTGYLTISGHEHWGGGTTYWLGYPNREVRQALNGRLLDHLTGRTARLPARRLPLLKALSDLDWPALEAQFRAIFAGVPRVGPLRSDIARYEGYEASVFYACLAALGLEVTVEDASAAGRLDLALRFSGQIYLFEFKVVERAGAGSALAQLRERGYAEKHRGRDEPIHLVGVEFSETDRNLTSLEAMAA